MNLIEIFSIITIHFLGDFVLQTDWQAKNKSKDWSALLSHTLGYSTVWFVISAFYGVATNNLQLIVLFPSITFIAHTITDYFTSRLNTKLYNKGDIHNFFVSVGFDQVLHYIQLFTTYYLLK